MFANLLRFIFFKFFDIVWLFHQIWISNSFPSFSFCFFKILLQFPSCLIVASIMQIDTTVAKHAVTRIVPIFAKTWIIVEPASIFSTCLFPTSSWTMFPFIMILWILQLILAQFVISITICPSINFCTQLSLFYLFRHLHILHIFFLSLFCFMIECLIAGQYLLLFASFFIG